MKPYAEQTYYEILEVPVTASREEISAAFDRAERLYDPESVAIYSLVGPEEAEDLRARLRQARSVLSDPQLREQYDRSLGITRARQSMSDPPSPPGSAHSTFPQYGVSYTGETAPPREAAPPQPVVEIAPPPPPVEIAPPPPAPPPVVEVAPPPPPAPPPVVEVAPAPPPAPPPVVEVAPPPPAPPPVVEVAPPPPRTPTPLPSVIVSPLISGPTPPVEVTPPSRHDDTREAMKVEPPPPAPAEPAAPPPPEPAIAAKSTRHLQSAPVIAEEAAIATAEAAMAGVSAKVKETSKPKTLEIPAEAEFNGELLRQVRKNRGCSLQQIADRTRIAIRHLENIEADRYASLPATVYLRGILVSLAKELALDPQRVTRSYLGLVASAPNKKG